MNMNLLCITCIVVTVVKVILADENNIFDYFNSDIFKTIQNHWQPERKSFENALVSILQQDYGFGALNVYVRKMPDFYKISDGFYFSDNIVNLILLETRLHELPMMIAPEVNFALASNCLHLEARLGRMIINSKYLLVRNQSDVVFLAADQDTQKKSPFSFQQVQDSGDLTIIAQDCILVGYAISTLTAYTANLGLETFKVTNCKFSVEIYSEGLGSPPVFGPYFSEEQSITIERMLSKPIRAELMPKLQGAIFSYINTSAIFGDKLPELRYQQNSILKETSKYMSGIVGAFVQNTIKKTQGILQLNPLEFSWNQTCSENTCKSSVKLKDIILYGLDTAYSAHIGGPFKMQSIKVAETIRFSTMQVRGKIYFQNATVNVEHNFAVELRDVAVNIEMQAKSSSFSLDPSEAYVVGWRRSEFSIIDLPILSHERRVSQSLITGYLVNELPKRLLDHISDIFSNLKDSNLQQFDTADADKNVEKPISEKHHEKKDDDENKTRFSDASERDSNDHESEQDTLSATERNSVEDETESAAKSLSNPSDNEIK